MHAVGAHWAPLAASSSSTSSGGSRSGTVAVAALVGLPRRPATSSMARRQQFSFVSSAALASSSSSSLRGQHSLLLGSSSSSATAASAAATRARCAHNRQQRPTQAAAAADAGAAGGSSGGGDASPAKLPQKAGRKRELSLQQRWRAAKYAVLETQQRVAQQLSQVPAVAALLQVLAAVNQQLQPLYAAWRQLQRTQDDLLESYNNFLAEETKRQWSWSKRYQKEMAWWSRVPPFMGYFAATAIYQAFMPVSLLAAVVLPAYFAWVMWDDWWRSPVFVATLLISPLKWVPWADKCLVWPGLI